MSSVILNDGMKVKGSFGKEINVPVLVQFVEGKCIENCTSTDSIRFGLNEENINTIIARPHLFDEPPPLLDSRLTDEFRYKPLLRGMNETPSKGDPVLLCSIGDNRYYLGPLNTDNYLDEFVGSTITGTTSGVTAVVKQAVAAVSGGDPATLYLQYTAAGTEATVASAVSNSTSVTLSAANTLIKVGQKVTGTGISGTVTVSNISSTTLTLSSAQTIANGVELTFTGTNKVFSNGETISNSAGKSASVASSNATGFGSSIFIEEGVYFISGTFVFVPEGSLILDKYTNTPNYIVGLKVTESEVTSGTDTSLLDPSQGSFNYAAPGANRLKLNPVLAVKSLTDEDVNFVERARLKDGNIFLRQDKPMYSIINEYIARRTHDESGDYIVKGLFTKVREHLNTANNGN